jgi:hypothetical protein
VSVAEAGCGARSGNIVELPTRPGLEPPDAQSSVVRALGSISATRGSRSAELDGS